MSTQEERSALTPRTSLYAYALRLHDAEPDGSLPRGGYRLPDPDPAPATTPPTATAPPQRPGSIDRAEAQAAATDAVIPLLTEPDTVRAADEVHRRLHALGVGVSHVRHAFTELPLEDEAAARALGRRLVRTGTSAPAVSVGLGLLTRLGEPEDVPYLKVLGLFRTFTRPAITALTSIDCPAAALVWLSRYTEGRELRRLVDALLAHDDQAARAGLLSVSLDPRAVGSETARRIAEAVMLDDIISDDPVDTRTLAQAGRLLSRMAGAGTYQPEILAYDRAVAAYEAFVTGAYRLPPGLDHYAILLSVALDLHSGPSVLLDWRPGRREALLDTLESVLSAPAWAAVPTDPGLTDPDLTDPADRRRVRWIRRAAPQPFTRPEAPGRLRVEVVVRDPADREPVETRLLIDGRPLVPEAFGRGPAHAPEYLLHTGRLRATAEPQEVQLAEAYCTEGCCGALYVTIRRDGDHVVWSDWRRPGTLPSGQPAPGLPEYRFDAPACDAEIARAENDHSWAWPARNAARLITAGLRERPGILARWDARMDWVGTGFHDPDTVAVSFTFRPGIAAGRQDKDGHSLQFIWDFPDDGTPPEEQAAAALHRLSTQDPKGYAEVRGGSRESAEALGYPWP
ncbi:hypothetical protein [Streptomyces hiroshimensis]|uniref:HEAT repeat domain-containing protein n=1 Tax=Streptomyces hiroshimensis TaxID=66424 RepID=A0ABQ2Z8P3_9ACTN|nr:hypothetical protein [Streptomyces hiroshimensis]GGY07045.1 hypothetical protein GCM10010324_62390 [Streptomyces hiroshimensis]